MNDYNLKTIREDFKSKGIFYTPKELCLYMKNLIDIEYTEIYDPTCGHGSLLSVFDNNIKKYGQDINQIAIDGANEQLNNFIGEIGDTLTEDKFKGQKFDIVIANPPFSIKYNPDDIQKDDERFSYLPTLAPPSKADYMFIFHCLSKIKDNGMAIIMNYPGILYRGNKEKTLRKYLIDNNYIDKVIHIAGDKFVDTKIATCVLVLKKNKKDKNIVFINDEDNITKTAIHEDIVKSDYNLTVSYYAQKEEVKEIIDPIELQEKTHKGLLNNIKIELDVTKMICEFEGLDFKKYLIDILNLVKSYLNDKELK